MTTDKTPRKQNPTYHVFRRKPNAPTASGHGDVFDHVTHAGPVAASNRRAAIEQACGVPKEDAADTFLVIPADELQLFTPRIKVERTVSWEPLPADPSALSVPAAGDGKERDQ